MSTALEQWREAVRQFESVAATSAWFATQHVKFHAEYDRLMFEIAVASDIRVEKPILPARGTVSEDQLVFISMTKDQCGSVAVWGCRRCGWRGIGLWHAYRHLCEEGDC